ncbi:MAG: BMP family ABC transporter substrate-binding protein [Clostridia bacterium]|nr:BMP family ABC transporter substrate-binding protein [Clostridia bacterium]
MKKYLSLTLALTLLLSACTLFTGCGEKDTVVDDNQTEVETQTGAEDEAETETETEAETEVETETALDVSDLKVGFIFLHDENSTYDKNFIDAAKVATEKLGLADEQVIFKVNVPEDIACYDTAAELADDGCDLIFADSFGHEDFMIQAAEEFTDVVFCHATGTKAHTVNLPNYFNAFASIYEGRNLVGVAAGLKLNAMIEAGDIKPEEAKMGYVGAHPYAEVKSGYTSFYLGAKSVCPTVTMDVKFTNSWFDIALEKEAANALINDGCVLISQHADSEGAPKACEEAGVPNVAYNLDTREWGPNTALVSSKINWEPYFKHIIEATINGTEITQDYCGSLADEGVQILGLNDKVAAEGTVEKLEEIKAQLIAGEIKVFDTAAFTVEGKTLEEYMADVDSDAAFTPDTNAIADGYFHESEYRSAPYFDIDIDGITIK